MFVRVAWKSPTEENDQWVTASCNLLRYATTSMLRLDLCMSTSETAERQSPDFYNPGCCFGSHASHTIPKGRDSRSVIPHYHTATHTSSSCKGRRFDTHHDPWQLVATGIIPLDRSCRASRLFSLIPKCYDARTFSRLCIVVSECATCSRTSFLTRYR